MKRLLHVFTRNWGLKLLALALALAVFYAVRGSIRAPRSVERHQIPLPGKAPVHGDHN